MKASMTGEKKETFNSIVWIPSTSNRIPEAGQANVYSFNSIVWIRMLYA